MKWNDQEQSYTFECTGRDLGYVGGDGMMSLSRDVSMVGMGWDFWDTADSFTPEERAEMADEMIARWQQFKDGDGKT